MPSKQVIDRKRSAESVNELVDAASERAAKALTERFSGLLEKGEKNPDWRLMFALLGRQITRDVLALEAKSDAHEKELGDDLKPRNARDAAYTLSREVATDARALVSRLHGDEALAEMQMSAPVPEDAAGLEGWMKNAIGALRDKKIKLAAPVRQSAKIDREALADELDEAHCKLGPALKAVAREAREAQATQVEKDSAMATAERSFTENCSGLATLLRLAGEYDLATRVRPSARRSAAEKPEGEEGGGDAKDPKGGGEKK